MPSLNLVWDFTKCTKHFRGRSYISIFPRNNILLKTHFYSLIMDNFSSAMAQISSVFPSTFSYLCRNKMDNDRHNQFSRRTYFDQNKRIWQWRWKTYTRFIFLWLNKWNWIKMSTNLTTLSVILLSGISGKTYWPKSWKPYA